MGDSRDLQRQRVLAAMASIVAERGWRAATVDAVVRRAGVSRRGFYDLFESSEACFLALLDAGASWVSELTVRALEQEPDWEGAIRRLLAQVLVFLDREPVYARVWMVETVAAGSWAFEAYERHVAALRELMVARWRAPEGLDRAPAPGSPESVGAMASVLAVICTHVLRRERAPLIGLLGDLMGVLTGNYLDEDGRAEQVRLGREVAGELLERDYPPPRSPGAAYRVARWPPPEWPQVPALNGRGESCLPAALRDPRAVRARACLAFLAEHPGGSNRQVMAGVGVASHAQASMLLARLLGLGLVDKRAGEPGRPNAWSLTPDGERAAAELASVGGGLRGVRAVGA